MSSHDKRQNPNAEDKTVEQNKQLFQELCMDDKVYHLMPNILLKKVQHKGNINKRIKHTDDIKADIILYDINQSQAVQTINNYVMGSNELFDIMLTSMYVGEESVFFVSKYISLQVGSKVQQFYSIQISCNINDQPIISLIEVAQIPFQQRLRLAEAQKDTGNVFYEQKQYNQAQNAYINALIYIFYSMQKYHTANEIPFLSLDGPTNYVTELRHKIKSNLGLVYQKLGRDNLGIMQFTSQLLEMKTSGVWTEDSVQRIFKRIGLFPMVKDNLTYLQNQLKQVQEYQKIHHKDPELQQELGIDESEIPQRSDEEINESYAKFNVALEKCMPQIQAFIAQSKKQQDQLSKRFMKGLVESSVSTSIQKEKKREGPVIITDDGKGNKQSNSGQQEEKKKTPQEKLESAEMKKNYAKMFIQAKRWDEAIAKYKEALYETIDDLQFPCITEEEKENEVNKIRDYGEEGLTDETKKIIEMRCTLFTNLTLCYQRQDNNQKVIEYSKICIGNQIKNNIILPHLLTKLCDRMNIAYKATKDAEEQQKLAKEYLGSSSIQNNQEAKHIMQKYLEDAAENIKWVDELRQKEYMAMIRKKKEKKTSQGAK